MRVYLDTNHWIALARVRAGKVSKHAGALGVIENGVASHKLEVVLSYANVADVMHTGREKWRMDLSEVMVELSRGTYVRPRHIAIKLEARDLVRRLRGLPRSDRFRAMVGTGTEAMLGAKRRIVGRDGQAQPLAPSILAALDSLDLQQLSMVEGHDPAVAQRVRAALRKAADDVNDRRRLFRLDRPPLVALRRDNAIELIRSVVTPELIEAMEEAGVLDPALTGC